MRTPHTAGPLQRCPITARRMGIGDAPSSLLLARKIVPALRWPFPVIAQCCETEKAMCVDAKGIEGLSW
ncbi:hypothetical protein AOLI_G00113860 [Acnodon oligacanthus]